MEMPRTAITSYEANATPPSEVNAVIPDSASLSAIIDLVSSDCEPDEVQGPLEQRSARAKPVKDQALEVHCMDGEIARGEPSVEAPSDAELLKLQEYVKIIPPRGQRETKFGTRPRNNTRCGTSVALGSAATKRSAASRVVAPRFTTPRL
ncbi:unnamed protein product [Phytophthora fragariaefolia]|uniref:Unnamed protein product n=1 Tax=Phytophthora fragariaefolia TaxID=1490495 RepID=A0A9W6Y192_9STRA|nr:unnamed protein product [Phytophthora fragariaefolia]